MPKLNFVIEGHGPMVVLSHSLGCDLTMWDEVAALLEPDYTVLRYDHRGHGKSTAEPGPFTIDDLADDAADLIRSHAKGPVHFVGLSMGGMTAQSLGARHPALVRSLVIANSAGHYDDAARETWRARVAAVREKGMIAVSEGSIQRWFTPGFRADPACAKRIASLQGTLEAMQAAPYMESCTAVSMIDFRNSNPAITSPSLVIAGAQDAATPPALSQAIVDAIPGARLAMIDAAHISAVELPVEFARLVTGFWNSLPIY